MTATSLNLQLESKGSSPASGRSEISLDDTASKSKLEPAAAVPSNLSPKALALCSVPAARKLVAFEAAQKLCVLPLGAIKLGARKVLSCVVGGEVSPEGLRTLQFISGLEPHVTVLDRLVVSEAINRAYKGDRAQLDESLAAVNKSAPSERALPSSRARLPLYPISGEPARFLAKLVDYGIAHDASDIHLIPTEDGATVRLRVDGELLTHDRPMYGLHVHDQIIGRLKVLCNLPHQGSRLPVDGEFKVGGGNANAHVRVNIMPTVHGDRAVLRLRRGGELLEIDALGINPQILAQLKDFTKRRDGMLLLCGPTGSGKSTTLYSVLNELKKQNKNVVSVEDPVEILVPGIGQTSIDEDRGLTFASALRSILRQDPNAILLGEMRDEESAKLAFRAALSGHQLLSTLHARATTDAFLRLRALGVDDWSMAHSLSLIVSQRLVPKLCNKCRIPDLELSQHLGKSRYSSVGCQACDGTGTVGRVICSESLVVDCAIRERISSGKLDLESIKNTLSQKNYAPISSDLECFAESGVISGRIASSLNTEYAS